MLHRMVALAALATINATAWGQVSIASLLDEMLDRHAIARVPEPSYTCGQFSSYDRASTGAERPETWWANADYGQFLRVEARGERSEHVMMDAEGPGAVVRIWSANPAGNLRVYLDGREEPVIEGPMTEVLGGSMVGRPLAQESSRGWNLFLPIPYAKRCVITSDAGGFYYQVNYRTYEAGTGVRTLTREELDESGAAIARANEALASARAFQDSHVAWATVKPGASHVVRVTAPERRAGEGGRGGALTRFEVTVGGRAGEDLERALRNIVLAGTFDGERTIWCPLGDFFGSGVGVNAYQDWYRLVDRSGTMACEFVMPFERAAELRLENLGEVEASLAVVANVEPWAWDDRSMHFWAVWRHEAGMAAEGAKGTRDWNYATFEGRGVLVGDNLAVVNPVDAWWGEGDEKIYVDGEAFPSHFGTGTEDYYGYAWCCNEPFEHPFHAQPRCDGKEFGNNWGHTAVTRVRALDAIPFEESLRLDMEVWHWKACEVTYASTTYAYARPGTRVNVEPDPAGASGPVEQPPPLPPPFVIPGVLEAEGLKVLGKSEGLTVVAQDMRSFTARTWSGESHLWVQGRKKGDFVEVEVPLAEWGPHVLSVYLTKSWDYGKVRVYVEGEAIGSDMDLFSGGSGVVRHSGKIRLGMVSPREVGATSLRVRFEVVGSNPESLGTRSFFGIDAIEVEPTQ